MSTSDIIKLIKNTYANDNTGVGRKTKTSRTVFCEVQTVSQSEFFSGAQAGLKPEYKFTVFRHDYENECIVEYNGVRYSVYRTYNANLDYTELYAQREAGIQNAESDTAG